MLTMLPLSIHNALNNLTKPQVAFENDPKIHIITLEGGHGVGKDLYAKILKSFSDYAFIIRFADPVREDFRLAGYPEDLVDKLKRTGMKFPEGTTIGGYDVSGKTVRESLIHIAETNKQVHGQYYYANWLVMDARAKFRPIIRQFESAGELLGAQMHPVISIIIPDLRFDPEVETLQELEINGWQCDANGGEFLKVKRTNIFVGDDKPSETGFDFYLPPLKVIEV